MSRVRCTMSRSYVGKAWRCDELKKKGGVIAIQRVQVALYVYIYICLCFDKM